MKGIEQDLFSPPNDNLTVIECPSCKTKFSLESLALSEAINEIEQPYFHCSKCDYVFQSGERKSSDASLFTPSISVVSKTDQVSLDFGTKITHPPRAQINTDLILDEPLTRKPVRVEPTQIENSEQESHTFGTFWLLAAVPGAALGFLLIITTLCFFKPGLSNSITSLTEKLHGLAPESTYLQNLEIEQLVLADGEKLAVISGEIINDGDTPIKGVRIQGELFDINGNALQVSSTDLIRLKRDNLTLLTGAALKERARSEQAELSIAANSKENFVLPLGSDLKKARYFAARIYSVQSSS